MTTIDVGTCPNHERTYEGLCKNCEVLICPSCVMFGNHKKHDIVSLREGAMYLRKAIDNEMFKGLLKREFCEEKVLHIREFNLLMEKSKAETVKSIENTFKGILNVLKDRRAELINEIIQKFAHEKEKIDRAEEEWEMKRDIAEKLNLFDKDKNDVFLLINTKFIMEGIRKLKEPISFNEIEVYNNIDTSLTIKDKQNEEGNVLDPIEYSLDDIKECLSRYITMGSPKVLNYKA